MHSMATATLDAVEAMMTMAVCSLMLNGAGFKYLKIPLLGRTAAR